MKPRCALTALVCTIATNPSVAASREGQGSAKDEIRTLQITMVPKWETVLYMD